MFRGSRSVHSSLISSPHISAWGSVLSPHPTDEAEGPGPRRPRAQSLRGRRWTAGSSQPPAGPAPLLASSAQLCHHQLRGLPWPRSTSATPTSRLLPLDAFLPFTTHWTLEAASCPPSRCRQSEGLRRALWACRSPGDDLRHSQKHRKSICQRTYLPGH